MTPSTPHAMLIPVSIGRPAIVERDGWRIYIGIHDEAHRRDAAMWKRRLREAHPDRRLTANMRVYTRQASSRRFGRVRRAYECWLERERQWYAALGLTPPEWRH